MNETRTLAEFIARLRYEDLPAPVVEQACRIILDTVGCAISAWSEDPDKSRVAAQLARIGATSPPAILEHAKGYLNAFSAEPRPQALTEGLGSKWEILQNGFKYFPSILASHSPIQAALTLVRKHPIAPQEIARIRIETYNAVKTHFSNKDVRTAMGARVSVPYCTAVAAIDRDLGQTQFTAARRADPQVREVLANTEVIADAEFDKLYPDKFPALGTGCSARVATPEYDRHAALSVAAAGWLVRHQVKLLAVDTPTPDIAVDRRPQGFDWQVHRMLLRDGVLISEQVTNLAALAGRRVEFMFCPLNICDSDGAPARVLARPIADSMAGQTRYPLAESGN